MVMERWGARQEWGQQAKAKVKAKAKEQEGRAETRIFSEEGKVRVEVGGGQCMSTRRKWGAALGAGSRSNSVSLTEHVHTSSK
jgi:hypothetical protein